MRNSQKGFTIIEMVIVIAIIGILATVLIPTYGNVVNSANESAAMQTARSAMTNWLASSTTAGGVPTTGDDAYGNTLYAAYIEYTGDNGYTYQYVYEKGGITRVDNVDSVGTAKVDFTKASKLAGVYATDSFNPNDVELQDYQVSYYRLPKVAKKASGTVAANGDYYQYYICFKTGGVYDYGNCTIYQALGTDPSKIEYYTISESDNVKTLSNAVSLSTATWSTEDQTITLTATGEVTVGATATFDVTFGQSTTNPQVTSSDTSVATATYADSQLKVTGVAEGTANITITADGASKTIKITVKAGA